MKVGSFDLLVSGRVPLKPTVETVRFLLLAKLPALLRCLEELRETWMFVLPEHFVGSVR